MILGGALASAASGGFSGRGALVGIGLNIYAVNNFSGPAAQAHRSLRALANEYRRTMTENLRAARNTFGAMAMAGAMVSRGFVGAYRNFAQFEYTMKGTQIVARLSAAEYDSMSKEALRLGETTMFRASAISEQMRQMAKAGQDYNQIMNNIRAVVAGAGASMENMETVTRVMIATMSQFEIPAQGAMHTMDRLTAAALGSRSTIESLGEGLKMAAADFHTLNIPLEHALGTLMQMANFGIDNTMAGTAVGNMLRYLTKAIGTMATGRQKQALDMLGLSREDFVDAEGNLRNIADIFEMLNRQTRTMSTTDMHTAYEALFGIRGKRAAMPLTMDPSQLRRHIETVNDQGIAVRNLNQMMDTHEGRIQMLISAWDTFQTKFGEAISPLMGVLTQTLRGLTRLMSWFSEGGGVFKEVAKWVFSGVAGLLLWKTAVWAIKAAFAGLSIAFVSNRVSHANMNKAMHTMWDTLKAKVFGYNAALKTVITSQELARKATMSRMQGSIFYDKSGRAQIRRGHTIIDPATGRRYGGKRGGFAPDALLTSLGMNRTKPAFVPRSRGTLPGGAGGRAAAAGLGRLGMGVALTKIAGVLTGPLGLALLVIPSVVTLLNRSLRKNAEATDANTRQLGVIETKRNRLYDPEFFELSEVISRNVESRLLSHYMKTGEANPNIAARARDANIIINLDGRRVHEDRITTEGTKVLNYMGY